MLSPGTVQTTGNFRNSPQGSFRISSHSGMRRRSQCESLLLPSTLIDLSSLFSLHIRTLSLPLDPPLRLPFPLPLLRLFLCFDNLLLLFLLLFLILVVAVLPHPREHSQGTIYVSNLLQYAAQKHDNA